MTPSDRVTLSALGWWAVRILPLLGIWWAGATGLRAYRRSRLPRPVPGRPVDGKPTTREEWAELNGIKQATLQPLGWLIRDEEGEL